MVISRYDAPHFLLQLIADVIDVDGWLNNRPFFGLRRLAFPAAGPDGNIFSCLLPFLLENVEEPFFRLFFLGLSSAAVAAGAAAVGAALAASSPAARRYSSSTGSGASSLSE